MMLFLSIYFSGETMLNNQPDVTVFSLLSREIECKRAFLDELVESGRPLSDAQVLSASQELDDLIAIKIRGLQKECGDRKRTPKK